MKIVAGIGSVDDYEEYAKAGADEIYFGYVPGEYYNENMNRRPLNRREVMYCNVQIGAESELFILKNMVREYKIPVSVVLNSLCYEKEQYPFLKNYVLSLMENGFNTFIVADHDLFLFLSRIKDIKLILSGESGEMNHLVLNHLKKEMSGCEDAFKRIIFPRQTLIEEMKNIKASSEHFPEEYEAFALNEKCHFTGAYCSSFHCDELCHICHLPYRIELIDPDDDNIDIGTGKANSRTYEEETSECTGFSGCALCSLWKLREAGITHLKVVSRGNDTVSAVNDIKALKRALCILEESRTEEIFINDMKRELFPSGCSNNCYY